MSDETEEGLSPEERLLKVIQGKGAKAGDTAEVPPTPEIAKTPSDSVKPKNPPRLRPKPAAVQPASETPPAPANATPAPPIKAQEPAKKPAKLAPARKKAAPAPAKVAVAAPTFADGPANPAAQDAAPLGEGAPVLFADHSVDTNLVEEDPVAIETVKESRVFGISVVNKCVAALVMFTIVVILAYEIISAFHVSANPNAVFGDASLPPQGQLDEGEGLPDITDLLASFRDRGFMIQNVDGAPVVRPDVPDSRISLKLYVQKNIVIIGLSRLGEQNVLEAILMDRAGPKMHIVREGDKISVIGGVLKIERISSDTVVGHDGVEEIFIGKKKA
ncbi:MAG: hypothetical protein ACI856_002662 [Kiritimatiellia bacterium]|jgi:hypothetical protein